MQLQFFFLPFFFSLLFLYFDSDHFVGAMHDDTAHIRVRAKTETFTILFLINNYSELAFAFSQATAAENAVSGTHPQETSRASSCDLLYNRTFVIMFGQEKEGVNRGEKKGPEIVNFVRSTITNHELHSSTIPLHHDRHHHSLPNNNHEWQLRISTHRSS